MASLVIMPKQGISVESCVISEFKKNLGDRVEPGDVLFVYETDKAVFEAQAENSGVLLARLYEESDEVPCLDTVMIIGEQGEDISSLLGDAETKPQAADKGVAENIKQKVEEREPARQQFAALSNASTGEVKISPRAKNLAKRSDADISLANGSGPGGRIIERDVIDIIKQGRTALATQQAQPSAQTVSNADVHAYRDVKLTNMRKIIGNAMYESLSNMAQFTMNSSFDASALMALRAQVKLGGKEAGLADITLNDMILFAVSRCLVKHPDVNANFMGDSIRQFENANIGVAVDAPRGLIVPTLFGANLMGLSQLSVAAKQLIEYARSGQISPDLLSGGTFTVTNLGTLGVESFTPVINPPQTAILGVCAITTRLKEDGSAYPAMGLSLTIDHRALDGAPAAKFLRELCSFLENFNLHLIA